MVAKTKQKSGCLSLFFPLLRHKTTNTVSVTSSHSLPDTFVPAAETITSEILPYRLRDDFLSPAEFSFYKVLCSLGGSRLTVHMIPSVSSNTNRQATEYIASTYWTVIQRRVAGYSLMSGWFSQARNIAGARVVSPWGAPACERWSQRQRWSERQ